MPMNALTVDDSQEKIRNTYDNSLLAEYSWEFVPAAVTTMVQAIFSSWGTSLMNELGFRHIRGRATACENGEIAPVTSWKTLAESSWF